MLDLVKTRSRLLIDFRAGVPDCDLRRHITRNRGATGREERDDHAVRCTTARISRSKNPETFQ